MKPKNKTEKPVSEDVPNLDAISKEGLLDLAKNARNALYRQYARHALIARAAREAGRIVEAELAEEEMDHIYHLMPDEVRW